MMLFFLKNKLTTKSKSTTTWPLQRIWIFLGMCLAFACQTTAQISEAKLKALATEKLGSNVSIEKNKSGSYALITQPNGQPRGYCVLNLKTGEFALCDKLRGGSVIWIDDTTIETFDPPGAIRRDAKPEDFKRRINIEHPESPMNKF